MKIGLLTDAPKHNVALMKISAWHKAQGDQVVYNFPLIPTDKIYASWLFENSEKYQANIEGGPGIDPVIKLPDEIEKMKPDYDLFPIDFSLGYTWRACPRGCSFCKVKDMWQENKHHSIWEFHDKRFKKICLLNNNTFTDPQWKETFQEIREADLIIRDENGYDLRLLDEEKAQALKKTRFEKQIHFAWDLMEYEKSILKGLDVAKKYKIHGMVYILVGYNTTIEQDLYRCQKISEANCDPYIMIYNLSDKRLKLLRDMINGYSVWRKYKTIQEAWKNLGKRSDFK